MPPSLSGKLLKKKWKIGALVGTGGCAQVYEVADVRAESAGGAQLVAKIAPLPVGLPPAMSKGKKRKKTDQEKHADMIYYEYTLYKGFLLDHGGVVEIPAGGYGEDHNLRYLVMTRLGPDVDAALKRSGPWTVARKAGYARQMLALLRSLHEKCKMVFVDVKPENFMFGFPGSRDEDKIFVIDFGLSVRYTGPSGSIKPQSNSAQVQGTPEFLSLKCHGGASAGRCDDLESLGYVILSMLNGSDSPLPWSGSTSVANGLATKKSTSLESLCRGSPAPMLQYMTVVRGMQYEDAPDYDALDAMLLAMQKAREGGKPARGVPVPEKPRSAKGTVKGKSKATSTEVEVCEGKANGKGKGKGVAEQPASPGRRVARRSERLSPREEETKAGAARGRATVRSAKVPVVGASGAAKRSRGSAKDKKDACSDESEGEDDRGFFDAHDVHDEDDDEDGDDDDDDEDDEVEVTRVVATKGGTKRSGRGAAAGAGAKQGARNGAVAKKGFLLEVVSGPHKGKSLSLAVGAAEVRVGRNAPKKNGLRLDNDFEVSDKHAVLQPEAGGIRCQDVGSLNGTFVNEDRLEDIAVLGDGDVLQVGQTVVQITR